MSSLLLAKRPIKLTLFSIVSSRISILLTASIFLLISACGQKTVEVEELKQYINDPQNGLYQHLVSHGANISVRYRPTDLILTQEAAKLSSASSQSIDSLRAHYESKAYFIVSFSKENQEIENQFLYDRTLYGEAIQYLSAGIAKDLYIVTKKDSLPAIGHIYPRMYGNTGASSILVVFDRAKIEESDYFDLVLNDQMLNIGLQSFRFNVEDIHRAPAIRF